MAEQTGQGYAGGTGGTADDGLCALFKTRGEADLAVEHLVQEHGVERGLIFIEPAGELNTAGDEPSGGDSATAEPGTGERSDAALSGAIRLTVAVTQQNRAAVREALQEAGGFDIEAA